MPTEYDNPLEQILHDLKICKIRDDVHEADDNGMTLPRKIQILLRELGYEIQEIKR